MSTNETLQNAKQPPLPPNGTPYRYRLEAGPTWFSRLISKERAQELLPRWQEMFGTHCRIVARDDCDFADPGGNSALRAATKSNPRNLPCKNCGMENRLTPKDVALGYQCDSCADEAEKGW